MLSYKSRQAHALLIAEMGFGAKLEVLFGMTTVVVSSRIQKLTGS